MDALLFNDQASTLAAAPARPRGNGRRRPRPISSVLRRDAAAGEPLSLPAALYVLHVCVCVLAHSAFAGCVY